MLEWATLFIDWLSLPSLVVLACLLVYRGWQKEFPLFLSYVITTEVVGLARLLTFRAPVNVYRNVYWTSNILLAVFAFLATYELFIKRLFPGSHKIRFFSYLFPVAALAIALLAYLAAVSGQESGLSTASLYAFCRAAARVYEFCRAAVLLFFVALMVFMGRRWSKQEFGIAFGFALDVSTSLGLIAFWSRSADANRQVPVIAYDIACLIWLYCFWAKPKPVQALPAAALSQAALDDAQRWKENLKDFISPDKR